MDWEYLEVVVAAGKVKVVYGAKSHKVKIGMGKSEFLKAMGTEGWEAVGYSLDAYKSKTYYLFKRSVV